MTYTLRGGSWCNIVEATTITFKTYCKRDYNTRLLGFRILKLTKT